jgi:hypothetical protein
MTTVIENEVQRVARLNKEILADAKREPSHGLKLLAWMMSLAAFKKQQAKMQGHTPPRPNYSKVIVYFLPVTANRYSAHIVDEQGELIRLNIPEAGYRLHASYKDGYQANGGNYSKIDHILDAMVYEVQKRWSPVDGTDQLGKGQQFDKQLAIAKLIL